MTKKIVTVVDATSTQGLSVVHALVNHPEFDLRAIVRSETGEGPEYLRLKGVHVVQADMDDEARLRHVFTGSYAIFAASNYIESLSVDRGDIEAMLRETKEGTCMAMAAAATLTLEHYVWSTLPNAYRISNGAWSIPHYQSKIAVDDFIREDEALFRKTTFVWVGFCARNLTKTYYEPILMPTPGNSTYMQVLATPASVRIMLAGDVQVNLGLFVRAALEQPNLVLPARYVLCATEMMTMGALLKV